MADSDDEDFLMDLLSYTCPFTGKKRTAGCGSSDDIQEHKRMKLLVITYQFEIHASDLAVVRLPWFAKNLVPGLQRMNP